MSVEYSKILSHLHENVLTLIHKSSNIFLCSSYKWRQRFRKLTHLLEEETVLEFQVDRDQQRDEIVTRTRS